MRSALVMARSGRRPGGADTRQMILDAARSQFAEQSYDAVSMRAVARSAGVDPALVHHYFDGKSELFAEVLQLPLDPAAVLPGVLDGEIEQLGERITRFFLGLWESPQTGSRMALAIRSAIASEEGAARLGDFVGREIMVRLAVHLPGDRSPLRSSLVGSQLIGIGVARYLVRLGPLAACSVDEVVAIVAPTLQRYLTGDLP